MKTSLILLVLALLVGLVVIGLRPDARGIVGGSGALRSSGCCRLDSGTS